MPSPPTLGACRRWASPLALLVLLSCRSSPAGDRSTRAEPTRANDGNAAPSTSRVEPVESADEDSGFEPALVATVDARTSREVVRFGWTAPCKLPVRHYNYRNDRGGSLMRMTLDFSQDGTGYRVRLADVAFETIQGQPADSPEIGDDVKRAMATAAAAMPYFEVSSGGEYEGLSGTDEIIEFVLAEVGPEASQQIAEVLRSPATKAQLEAKSGDYWKGWVQLWIGLELPPGETVSQPRRLPFYGDAFHADLETANLGAIEGHPDLRLYRSRQVLEGPEAARIMLKQLRALAKQTGGPTPPDDAIKSFRRDTTMHVAIDPRGARPHRARYQMVTEVNGQRRIEVTDWEFDWPRAQGCKP